MPELFQVRTPSQALSELLHRIEPVAELEQLATSDAFGRVLGTSIIAHETLPSFARSTMDGYAVWAADTFGASDAAPAYLRLTGEVRMGVRAVDLLESQTAQRVHTGAMLPPGADAVVIQEHTILRAAELEVLRAVAPGENTLTAGADVRSGETVLAADHELRAQDLGALHALGILEVEVRRRPLIAILSTGDEVVPPDASPALGKVRDVNAVTLAATVARAGGRPRNYGIVPDDGPALEARARAALADCDALVLSAGSSVSARDLTAGVLDRLGTPGVVVHGIALRPGKPTILALCNGKPVVGLPGNPVSALVVAWRIVRPLVRRLAGTNDDGVISDHTFEARLTASVASRPGREDYVPCTLDRTADGKLLATPVFGESNLIFTLVRAHGLIAIPLDRAGAAAGESVRVIVP